MKKMTENRLKNIALFYLERYETSSGKLRQVLNKRLLKAAREQEIPPQAQGWIENIIEEMQRLGYINDTRYTQNAVERLCGAGKSRSFIRAKLKLAGISDEEIDQALSETDELTSARLMVQKKHLGNDFKRDLARLARAGFSYEIAREALDEVYNPTEF